MGTDLENVQGDIAQLEERLKYFSVFKGSQTKYSKEIELTIKLVEALAKKIDKGE